ncbi:Fe-S protein assembly co-chaperone HscB [Mucilaginibacter pallidiroseus]|uniref:Fe-S protein assembly co-chaperone HscB n=1 Tax=Mucilaginibacter pallidiroseus TaxID=2599295 RepID=A0A563UIH6_9SPHI|nr:Fe-S protein assembly co-chaperone HscB [Mucilaginibacter pallidiroseus]TWR31165.1 Fe-S protein assembly co-chaperone HscB [Mucilaginibacter pallidiroseus]
MNYFEFYDIPESFLPDQTLIKKKFYALSKQYHPDFHANQDDERQQEILELSTLNNKAYQTLSNPNRVVEYVLREHDLINEGAKPQLPSNFLMEMMDINERIMEIENMAQFGEISVEVLAIESDMNYELHELIKDYSELDHTAQENRLNEIANIYYKQKYLLRIKESLDTFAARL